jgi:hypothetical protein
MTELQSQSISKIERDNNNSEMLIDTSGDKINTSGSSKDSEFTVVFLKDQLLFLTDRIKKATSELEEKERLI